MNNYENNFKINQVNFKGTFVRQKPPFWGLFFCINSLFPHLHIPFLSIICIELNKEENHSSFLCLIKMEFL